MVDKKNVFPSEEPLGHSKREPASLTDEINRPWGVFESAGIWMADWDAMTPGEREASLRYYEEQTGAEGK